MTTQTQDALRKALEDVLSWWDKFLPTTRHDTQPECEDAEFGVFQRARQALAAEPEQQPVFAGRVFVDQLTGKRDVQLSADGKQLPDMTRLYASPIREKKEGGKTVFAIACLMSGTNGSTHTFSGTLHTRIAETAEEARGGAITDALKLKPGLGVHEVLCMEVAPTQENQHG